MNRRGFTIIELLVAMAASIIVILIVGSLIVSGHRSWTRAFKYANSKSQLDSLAATITFGTFGRKSNRMDYALYEISGGNFERLLPATDPEEVVTGQAVEFRYWDTELNNDIMNTSITATAYALFYLDGDKLLLDLGPYPPGAVDAAGNKLEGSYVSTITLAENVSTLEFSHTTRNLAGDGKGCVRMSFTLNDPDANPRSPQTTVTAATLMRNTWP
ncbi:MAG: prepilin-type N-terminal cleavage/methylation domain-containing protein [Planctomycetota bacterium]